MSKAARDVRASAAIIARKDRLVARKEEMMAEKRRLHAMGRVSVEEARAFIDKYRCGIIVSLCNTVHPRSTREVTRRTPRVGM